ncbi:MAG: aminotransferase class I/II-fold pyridoxal phosphate-dependent enzyme [Xanthomonadales bacterium]|nr:aminotransferase class I/II-fold pyridoxal phosphate-dependent enzyme [Xanthomonadales bacterium]
MKTPQGNRIQSDGDFVTYLLDEANVACVQGEAFGLSPYFRISYATSTEALETACERIKQACDDAERVGGGRVTTKTPRHQRGAGWREPSDVLRHGPAGLLSMTSFFLGCMPDCVSKHVTSSSDISRPSSKNDVISKYLTSS